MALTLTTVHTPVPVKSGHYPGDDVSMPTPRTLSIEAMADVHAAAVLSVYQAGIDEGDATFETVAPDWAGFCGARLPDHRFVALRRNEVAGWVAVAAVSTRPAYAGVVEHSVYVAPAARRTGVASALLAALVSSTERAGIWTVQSHIFPENKASVALHARHGFRTVGVRERIARQHGRWRDVVLIERRSRVTD
jgi:L-amino acid N-acyltransferase YncA